MCTCFTMKYFWNVPVKNFIFAIFFVCVCVAIKVFIPQRVLCHSHCLALNLYSLTSAKLFYLTCLKCQNR
jgi:hypothetical protein